MIASEITEVIQVIIGYDLQWRKVNLKTKQNVRVTESWILT